MLSSKKKSSFSLYPVSFSLWMSSFFISPSKHFPFSSSCSSFLFSCLDRKYISMKRPADEIPDASAKDMIRHFVQQQQQHV